MRHQRNRGRRWRRTREEHLNAAPTNRLCAHCLQNGITRPFDIVDHKVPVCVDPSREFDLQNLQSLCHDCDRIKSANDGSQRR